MKKAYKLKENFLFKIFWFRGGNQKLFIRLRETVVILSQTSQLLHLQLAVKTLYVSPSLFATVCV